MFVKDLFLIEPVFCLIDDYMDKAAELLSEHNQSCLPVIESPKHKNVIGVIDEKTICRAVAAGLEPKRTKAGRIMSSHYLTVSPETEIDECRRIMQDSRIEFLFVAETDNSCSGIVTKNSLPEKNFAFSPREIQIQYARTDRLF